MAHEMGSLINNRFAALLSLLVKINSLSLASTGSIDASKPKHAQVHSEPATKQNIAPVIERMFANVHPELLIGSFRLS